MAVLILSLMFCVRSDPFAGPLMELEKWKKRQKMLTSITDQLKGKECKAVIAVLITAKCKVLKRWKSTDARYTAIPTRVGTVITAHTCPNALKQYKSN